MSLTNSFNGAATGGSATGDAGQSQSPSAASSSSAEPTGHNPGEGEQTANADGPTTTPPPQHSSQDEGVSPNQSEDDPVTINETQDRHFDELGQFYSDTYRQREKLNGDFERRYGESERQLRQQIDERQSILDNSSASRLFWLKFTGQIPKNAEEDLETKRRNLESIAWQKETSRRGLDQELASQREMIRARQDQERKSTEAKPELDQGRQSSGPQTQLGPKDRIFLTREQAEARLEQLEAERATPEYQHHMPPPSLGTIVDQRVEESNAIDISKLRAFLAEEELENELDEDP